MKKIVLGIYLGVFCLLCSVFAFASAQNPIGYWSFNEGSGNTAYDSAGNNHGTLYGNPVWTNGISGKAIQFDGINDYVIMSTPYYNRYTSLTYSFWTKGNAAGTIFSEGYSGDYVPFFWIVLNSGLLEVRSVDSNWNSGANFYSNLTGYGGTWKHIAITDNNGDLRVYVNGALDNNNNYIRTGSFGSMNQAAIGATARKAIHTFFNGTIDEVAIYGRALTPSEISDIYNGINNSNSSPISGSPWSQNGNNIYYDKGYVGIWTSNPTKELEVSGNVLANDVCTIAGKCLSASGSGGSCNCPWATAQSNNTNSTNGTTSVNIYYTNGSVGIGTQNPGAKLQIDAKGYETGLSTQTAGNGLGVYAYSNYTAIQGYGFKGNGINAMSYTGNAVSASSSYGMGVYATSYNQTAGYFSSTMGYGLIVANGNAGIGITAPTEKLDVNGNVKIRALNGTGQAYACLDSAGKLYRSSVPCV